MAGFIKPFVESFIWKDIPEWTLNLGGVILVFLIGFLLTVVIEHYYKKFSWLAMFVDGIGRLASILFSKNRKEEGKGVKGEIVLVGYPYRWSLSLGLVTEVYMEEDIRMLRTFVAKSPTFWTGDVVSYPEEEVIHTNISKPEWAAIITSGGTFGGGEEFKEGLREGRRRMEQEWKELTAQLLEKVKKDMILKGGRINL